MKSYCELLDPLSGSGEGGPSAGICACATASDIGGMSSFLTLTLSIGLLNGFVLKNRLPSDDKVETLTESVILT